LYFFVWQFSHQLFSIGVALYVSAILFKLLGIPEITIALMVVALVAVIINTYRQNRVYFDVEVREIDKATSLHGLSMLILPFILMAPLSVFLIKFYDFIGYLV
jgi:hypothetical protein